MARPDTSPIDSGAVRAGPRRPWQRLAGVLPLAALMLAAGTAAGQGDPAAPVPAVAADGRLVSPDLALVNAHVVNIRDGSVLRDAVVEVRDGHIASVGTAPPAPDLATVDMAGKYLVPGFMDGHWHGRTLRQARRALESGVTTMKSANSGGLADLRLRDAVARGYLPGPQILAVGVYVKPSPGNPLLTDPRLFHFLNQPVRGIEAVRELVRVNAANGVDWIKTQSGGTASLPGGWDPRTEVYDAGEMAALVDEATRHGLPVACHALGEHVILVAVRAGCRTIEHGYYMTEAALRAMREHGTVWVPTYASSEGYLLPHDDYDSASARRRAPYIIHNMRRMLRAGHDLGVTLITSTDTRYGDRSMTRVSGEIVSFVEYAGMSPLEALQAASLVPAGVYGLQDKTGAVEAGLEADLVGFDRNPLEDIHVVQDPVFVMSNGHLIHHRTETAEGYVAPRVEWTGYGTSGPRP